MHSTLIRVGQNRMHTVYLRFFWRGNHQIYGHIRIWPTLVIIVHCEPQPTPGQCDWGHRHNEVRVSLNDGMVGFLQHLV
jgi:hypothetical protein